MFFNNYPEFVQQDPRIERAHVTVSEESLYKRCKALLPEWIVKDKTVLDLGSCLGSFGHWCLHNGAKHYTGVEIHKEFTDKSVEIMGKYNEQNRFTIINSSVESFLLNNEEKYDIVVASGILHGFINVVEILKQVSGITREYFIVETLETEEPIYPSIHFKPYRMLAPSSDGSNRFYTGITPVIGFGALSYVMKEFDFSRDGGKIYPEKITNTHDAYNEKSKNRISPDRYMARFKKNKVKLIKDSLQYNIHHNIIPNRLPGRSTWQFDDSVAARFQNEARTNIPDYDRVIDTCLTIANKRLKKDSKIIDVGSALGHTMDVFIKSGYKDVIGVDNSSAMIENSLHREKVIKSDNFPDGKYDMVLINWTLHFIEDKRLYLESVYNNMNNSGILILTDKTTQCDLIEDIYYDFKRSNGISEEYIQSKKQQLNGYMKTMSADWYPYVLRDLGFKYIQIINSRYGFVTYYGVK